MPCAAVRRHEALSSIVCRLRRADNLRNFSRVPVSLLSLPLLVHPLLIAGPGVQHVDAVRPWTMLRVALGGHRACVCCTWAGFRHETTTVEERGCQFSSTLLFHPSTCLQPRQDGQSGFFSAERRTQEMYHIGTSAVMNLFSSYWHSLSTNGRCPNRHAATRVSAQVVA